VSPGVHYIAQTMLAEATRRLAHVRVRVVQASTGALSEEVAAGDLDLGARLLRRASTRRRMRAAGNELAVAAVGAGHRLASRKAVWLRELRGETFALVDAHEGPGFNRAVVALCEAAGFRPRTAPDPQGPMAWEAAVRLKGCVGLTARSAAVSSARDLRLLELRDGVTFPLALVRPALPLTALKPVARTFRSLGRELVAAGSLDP